MAPPILHRLPDNKWPGLYITQEIDDVLALAPHIVVNLSGGKDSTVMAFLLVLLFKYILPISFIFADTDQEYQDNPGKWMAAEPWARMQANMFGYDLAVVRHPKTTLYQKVRERGMWPSPQNRWCTSDYKRLQIEKWVRNQVYEPVILNCLGIRAAEGTERAKKAPWAINETLTKTRCKLTSGPRTAFDWYPIFRWQTETVYQFIDEFQLPLHPIYQFLGRYSCQVCIYNTPRDLAAIQLHNPEAIDEVATIEQEIGHTMFMKGKKPITVIDLIDKHKAGQLREESKWRQTCML